MQENVQTFQFRIESVTEDFKIIALSDKNVNSEPDFWNIGNYVETYKSSMPNRSCPSREVAINCKIDGEWAYYFGTQVTSFDIISEGLTPISVPVDRFLVMSFNSKDNDNLLNNLVGRVIHVAREYCKLCDLLIDEDYQPIIGYKNEDDDSNGPKAYRRWISGFV